MVNFKDGQLILAWRKSYRYAVATRFIEFYDNEVKCYAPGERTNLHTKANNVEWFTLWCPFDIVLAELPIEYWYKYKILKGLR